MPYEARITVHQEGSTKPDYADIHRRMAEAGFSRVLMVGGRPLSELHGMYRKFSTNSLDAEQSNIEKALKSVGFRFSIELFQVTGTRTFNLEPAPDYSALFGLLGSR